MVVGGFQPPDALDASWFGRVLLGKPGERWPTHAGKPMIPLCQINCRELPYIPESLEDLAFLTLFISADKLPSGTPNGEGWELRAYSSLLDLVEIAVPQLNSPIRAFPVRWELIEEDYPCWEDVAWELRQEVGEKYHGIFENIQGSKIGGWPSLIQGELFWAPNNLHPANPQYVFQIDTEEKAHWAWGDTGTGYFGRGTGDSKKIWALEWDSY